MRGDVGGELETRVEGDELETRDEGDELGIGEDEQGYPWLWCRCRETNHHTTDSGNNTIQKQRKGNTTILFQYSIT